MSYSLAFSQALLILIFVASKVEQGLYEFIPTQKLSQELQISPSTAGLILRQLSRAGIIETREGASGGVRLGIPPEKVTALDVFRAIEQERPMFQMDVQSRITGEKATKAQEAILQLFATAESAMKQRLEAVTIGDFINAVQK